MTRPTHDSQGIPVMIGSVNMISTPRYVSAVSTVIAPDDDKYDVEPPSDIHYIHATSLKERHSNIPYTTIACRWGTSLDTTVNQMMKTTTQRSLRYLQGDLKRRFWTRQTQLQN